MDDKLNKEEIWNKCLLFIKNRIQETAFQTWFDGVQVASISDEDITLLVPNQFHFEWLESKYRNLIGFCRRKTGSCAIDRREVREGDFHDVVRVWRMCDEKLG